MKVPGTQGIPRTIKGLSASQVWDWAASESKFIMIVPFPIASSIGNNVFPGTCARRRSNEHTHSSSLLPKKDTKTYPAVLDSLLPRRSTLTNTDNDVETVVTGVERLTVSCHDSKHKQRVSSPLQKRICDDRTLRSVSDHGENIVLEVSLELRKRPAATSLTRISSLKSRHGERRESRGEGGGRAEKGRHAL